MEEMSELFYQDAYLREFEAEVIDCFSDKKGYGVILSDTLFYPEGGGQPADKGTLNGLAVIDVKRKNGAVVHYLKDEMAIGTKVIGSIDWNVRFDHMVQHSGEHLFTGVIHQMFGYDNTGFHMGDECVVLDYSGPLSKEDLAIVEQKTFEAIVANIPFEILYPSKDELAKMPYRFKKEIEGKLRIVKAGDVDMCACCGTHVHLSGEIGYLKVIGLSNKKDGARVSVLFGQRAIDYMNEIYRQNQEISALLSSTALKTSEGVKKLYDDYHEKRAELSLLQRRMLDEMIEAYPLSNDVIIREINGDNNLLRYFCEQMVLLNKAEIAVGLLANGKGYNYAIISHQRKLKSYAKPLNQALNGRGGGSDEIIQGSFECDLKTITQTIANILK